MELVESDQSVFESILSDFQKTYTGFDCQGILSTFFFRLLEQINMLTISNSTNTKSIASLADTGTSLANTAEQQAVTIARLTAELIDARAANQGKAAASAATSESQQIQLCYGIIDEERAARALEQAENVKLQSDVSQLKEAVWEYKSRIEGADRLIRELQDNEAYLRRENRGYQDRLDKLNRVCDAVAALSNAESGREEFVPCYKWEARVHDAASADFRDGARWEARAAPDDSECGSRPFAVSESDPRLAINEYVKFLITQMGINNTKAMEQASYEIAQNIGSSDGDHSEQEQEEHNAKFVAERIRQLMGETIPASHSGGGRY